MLALYVLAGVEGCVILVCAYLVAWYEFCGFIIQRQNRRFSLEAKRANEARYVIESGVYR